MQADLKRAEEFAARFGLRVPILLAPMAGACPPSLSIAVARAGGLGACGALTMTPGEMLDWAEEFRASGQSAFQVNLWIPDPAPARDAQNEARIRTFLERWGPPVPADAGDSMSFDFDAQCEALLEARVPVLSSMMGLFPPAFVKQAKDGGAAWFATVTTVREARQAADAGADVIVAQGMEAGGHRGAFDAGSAEREMVGLFSLLPAVVDAVDVPVVAAGGVADARGVRAALALGASGVQIGTGFLRCPEATLNPAWSDALGRTMPEDTMVTRGFSGRPGRGIANEYTRAWLDADAPHPAPHPVQRGLVSPMRAEAAKAGDINRMQAWAGQSAALAKAIPAADLVQALWIDAIPGA